MILCASLIQAAPNIAGLCRTCEIMNINSLVINDKNVVRTEEFKAISVTSHKWLPIYEVQIANLLAYLKFQKENGYKLVALEHSAESKQLSDFIFPEKCILLLGKEDEGIPQEYLDILDDFIQIPSSEMAKSTNIHVSGAICVWEYTKQ